MQGLPPGQRAVQGFPRFGVDTRKPPPVVSPDSPIEIAADGIARGSLAPAALTRLPRVKVEGGFHCVAGWSALGLSWEGWSFRDVFDTFLEPAMNGRGQVAYLVFVGADDYRSIVTFEDAIAANVLLADRLDGAPLSPEHGAPLRLVSPDQYGFMSTKHLRRIELHSSAPPVFFHPSRSVQLALRTLRPHSRARVWEEERHRYVPSWLVRPIYRRLVPLPAPPLATNDDRRSAGDACGP